MSDQLSPELEQMLDEQMLLGRYESRETLLRAALEALRDREEDWKAVHEGFNDLEAGRVRPFAEVAKEIALKHGFSTEP